MKHPHAAMLQSVTPFAQAFAKHKASMVCKNARVTLPIQSPELPFSKPYTNQNIQYKNSLYLQTEMLSIVLLFYASQIESGERSLKDYYSLHSSTIVREIKARKLIVESRISARKQKNPRTKEAERQLLETLKLESQR